MKTAIVVGGGIIGLCIAEKLVNEGFSVTIVEKDKIAAGASYGNAGGIAFSEVMPMASKAMIFQATRWLFDRNGPFAVIPRDLTETFGWLVRFAFAARNSIYQESLQVQSELMQIGKETLPNMLARTNLKHMVRTTGALYLYDTKKQYEDAKSGWKLREGQGVAHEFLPGKLLHDFQQGLLKSLYGGVYAPNYQAVTDPNDFCQEIYQYLKINNVQIVYDRVNNIVPTNSGATAVLESGNQLNAEKIIVAAGPWSKQLCSKLGDAVPLIGERGYNTTLPKKAFASLDKTFFFAPHGFVISPLSNGVRIGGASEIASLDRAPNYQRSEAMLKKAKQLVPALQIMDGKQWMGRRPTTPDTLPVISVSGKSKDIIYAFGHGHLGLTQATATAQLIHNLIEYRSTVPILGRLGIDRFS